MKSILLIEANPEITAILVEALDREGYSVTASESAFGALAAAQRLRPDLILLNLDLPYRSGAGLLRQLRADPHIAVIPILLVAPDPEVLSPERRALAERVLRKPADASTYCALILSTIAQVR